MESRCELDVFNHKNKSKILLSFLDGKNEIVSGIGLQQLLQFIKEKNFDESLSVALQQDDNACWLCLVKEKLFKDLWKVCDGTAKIIATEESLASSVSDNKPLSVDRIWKVVRNAGNVEDNNGITIVRRRKLTDCVEINGTRSLSSTNEINDKNCADWKTLCINVAEVLLKYSDESLHGDLSLETHEKSHSCTFAVESTLSEEELKSRVSSQRICQYSHKEESSLMVKFQICYKCLSLISFDVHKPEERGGIVHSLAQLVNHLIATIYVTANEFCEQDLALEPKEFSSEEKNNEPYLEKPCSSIAVVCKKDETSNEFTTESSQDIKHSHTQLQLQKPSRSIGPPITVSLSSCIFTNTLSTVKKSSNHGNEVPRGGLRISKLPATFNFQCKKNQCLKQGKPLVQLSGKSFAKLPVLTVIGKNGILSKRKPISVLSTLPGVSATFKKTSHAKTFTLKPDQRKRIKNFTITTVDTSNRPKCKKYLVKMLHPTTSKPIQTVTASNKVIRVIQSTTSSLTKISPPDKASNLPQKLNVKCEPLLTSTPMVKDDPTRICSKSSLRRREKPAQLASEISTSTLPEATVLKTNSPDSKINEETEAATSTEAKLFSQQSPAGCSKQTRVKTPSKRKGTGQGASMKSIVHDFLATSSSVEKLEQNNTIVYNAKRQRRGRRRRQVSTNKIIPIPYESHYLCIYETLAKKGWKAYWFRKCRCARSGKKKIPEEPIEVNSSQHVGVNDGSVRQQISKRKKLLKDDASLSEVNKLYFSGSLPVVKFSSSSMNTSNNSSKLQDLASETNLLGVIKTEPAAADTVVSSEKHPSSSPESFALEDITAACDIDAVEQYQPQESNAVKALSSFDNPTKQLSRTELLTRRKKVESVHKSILKNIRVKNNTLDLQQNKTLCSVVMQPYVFSQFFQEMDKQPSCLDVVSVHSSVLQELPDLCKEAVEIERRRNSRCSTLLKPLVGGNVSSCKSIADSANHLHSIWAFGKSDQFFLEKKKTTILQRKKIILEKRKQAISKKQKNFEKRRKMSLDTGKAGKKFFKSLEARSILKRSLLTFGKKGYQHRSHRPKATRILVNKKYFHTEEESFVPIFGFKPYSSSWNVPHTSVSEVVRKLEHVWCEEEKFRGFVGLHSDQIENGLVTLTPTQVNHALSALKTSNETFTFSSKKKKGKNNVLLIRRKLVASPELNSQESDKEAFGSDCSSASPILSKRRKGSDHEQIETNSQPVSPKLLLKLRKTGEVSGSAIYSVPLLSAEEEISDQSVCNGAALAHQISDVNTTETSSLATGFDMSSQNSPEHKSSFDKGGELTPTSTCSSKPDAKQVASGCTSPETTGGSLHDQHFFAVKDVSVETGDLVVDTFTAATSKPVSASNFTLGNNKETVNRSISEIDTSLGIDNNDILSSTMICSTPLKVPLNSIDLLFATNDYDDLHSSNLCDVEKKDHEIIDWDRKILEENILEELLQFISVESLDILEKIFIFDQKHDISPLDLLKKLKTCAMLDRSSCNTQKMSIPNSQVCTFEKKRYPCIANGSFTCSPNESKKILSSFSFDSPETVRGMSQSKKQDESCDTESPLPPNSPTESEREFQSSPPNLPSQELDVTSGINALNQQMKACNVILKPLEGLLKDFKTNRGNTSGDDLHSQLYHNEYSFSLSSVEPSARELNRLLKNQALNGAYWKPIASDPRSPVSYTPASHWHLRERRKRTHSESTSIANEDVISKEHDEAAAIDEKETVIPQPKRKKVQHVKYFPSSDKALHNVADCLWNDNSNHDKESVSDNAKPKSLNCEVFRSLFKSRINCDRVRSWILRGTLSNPRPLRFPFMFARRNAAKQAASKTNCRDANEVASSSGDESGRTPKKNAKVSGRDSITKRSSKSLSQDDVFEELRQTLFKLRHPRYKGDLCNGSNHTNVSNPSVRSNRPLSLLRVNAEEARKKDSPSLCSDMLVEADKRHLIRKPKVVQLAAESNIGSDEETSSVCSHRKIDEEIKRNAVVVPLETIESNPIEVAAPVALSSRGRALKPSIRNRSQSVLMSTRNTRSSTASSSPIVKKPVLTPSCNHSNSSQVDPPPTRNREKSRFVNKHSTSGSYIQKVIESGLYDG